jgi:hypothetical protein
MNHIHPSLAAILRQTTRNQRIVTSPSGERYIECELDGPHGPEGPPCSERPDCQCDECQEDRRRD